MIRFGVAAALAFCFALLLMPVGSAETTNDPPVVVIEEIVHVQSHGVFITYNYTGIYVDESQPEMLSWELFDGWNLLDQGNITENITHSNHNLESTRTTWNWQFESEMRQSTTQQSCNCYLKVTALDSDGNIGTDWRARYAGGWSGQDIVGHTPLLVINQDSNSNVVSADISIDGSVVDRDNVSHDNYISPNLQWWISNDPATDTSCRTWTRVQGVDLPWMNATTSDWQDVSINEIVMTNGVTGESMGNLTQFSASYSMTLDTSGMEDGAYQFVMRAIDNSGHTSVGFCKQILIDNTQPIALISGVNHANERAGIIQFDGSGSSDQYWGREGLVFLWILEDEFGQKTVESGIAMRTFAMDASQSGNYSLTLTVADGAGFSDTVSHQFNIINQEPVAGLRIGGQPLTDGDSVTLIDANFWNIECGDSTDTVNDKSGLICTWYIDGEPVMTGFERQLIKPEDLSKPHTLMLVVTDDDDASDTITVTFGVQGTPSDPMYNDDSLEWGMWLIFAAISLVTIIGGLFLYTRYNKYNTTIPKWKPE